MLGLDEPTHRGTLGTHAPLARRSPPPAQPSFMSNHHLPVESPETDPPQPGQGHRGRSLPIPSEALGQWALRLLGGQDGGTLSCGFLTKRPGWDSRRSQRPSTSLVLCLAGEALYDGRWPIVPGDVFFRFAGVPHDVEITRDPWHECWLSFGPGIEQLLQLDRTKPVFTSGVDGTWVRAVAASITPLRHAGEEDLPRQLAHLLALAAELLHPPLVTGLDLPKACRLLADPGTSLAEVAIACDLTYDRFRREFQQRMGISPGAYRSRRLMEEARFWLMTSQQPIHAIAETLGFANPFAFTNAFRRSVGVSPSAWRRGHALQQEATLPKASSLCDI